MLSLMVMIVCFTNRTIYIVVLCDAKIYNRYCNDVTAKFQF